MMMKKCFAAVVMTAVLGLSQAAIAQDTLAVGVTTSGIPFTFIDTKTQESTGAMVDLAKAISDIVGAEPEFNVVAFSALIPALTTGKIDLISAGMFATDKRKEIVDFTQPVYQYGDGMFVAADDSNNYSLDDLAGETVGAQVGSVFADKLRALGTLGEVKLYDSIADIMRDVKLGRIKAGVGDLPVIAYQIKEKPQLGVRLVEDYKPMGMSDVALAVDKGNPELLAKVNAAITELKDSGKLDEIFAKYGL
ncbi:substrate-binding periplasmic protein [Thalassospira sp. UBA1131]|uniref:substrate-binding periplasmic protein n=1 Tax=Thalassospira sp. UBA1131 TaxID=1947672 RepID=UPI0026000851|nr:ABC transporter substrate-binding protein [Thalassospira sp. UBA1131]